MDTRIYKKDSSGKIRYLSISVLENFVIQESGVVGSNNPVINKSACVAKNVGRSNATTPEEQALVEAQAKIVDKLKVGYFRSIEEAQNKGGADFLLPMLAKDYKKEKAKVQFPCYVQPKLDGMRALYSEDNGFISRTGRSIDTLGHIVVPEIEGLVLDGETYAHGESFQENMRLIKKYRPGKTEQVKYHVYDLVMDAPFPDRYLKLQSLVQDLANVKLVHTARINDEEELLYHHQLFISQGYEGTIIRHSTAGYEVNKRSSQLLKYKDFIDETFIVVDVIPSESRPDQGVIVCTSNVPSHKVLGRFNCGMKFSHFERKVMLDMKEEYIGRKAEVRFFEYTDGGLPRFPVCVGFRED